MRHGESRNHRKETVAGPEHSYLCVLTGRVLYSAPTYSHTFPVCERYCAYCRAWIEQRGILAVLWGCPICGADW